MEIPELKIQLRFRHEEGMMARMVIICLNIYVFTEFELFELEYKAASTGELPRATVGLSDGRNSCRWSIKSS